MRDTMNSRLAIVVLPGLFRSEQSNEQDTMVEPCTAQTETIQALGEV
jgi:hypothetical protein